MEFEDYQADNLEKLIESFMDKDTYLKFQTFCWEQYLEKKRQEEDLIWEEKDG